ncbi:metallo-beta-lactamase domain-containing protein [Thermochaetoides thermophila DSM 1495]|uniref:Metallo-beta-lactamase domain-containing protein n=1 Tax=Chaetomium thermophilum (strain DSM 1495 / CBS 144.50 / IMI 039719) TaxID=759272 RepID=G0SB38_CHATD|nr:metallo-beta-lactamase domain-containing protein [Thermochaetoides thermophila DSM 1495]EGS19418.1 metallo-beta-lactamase domain-containing protein [Thermochaetoides thermophila DSM 1495]
MTSLPALPEITPLRPGLIRILAGNPGKFTLQGTNTYLLGTGRQRLLIDTGEGKPSWIAAVKSALTSSSNQPNGEEGTATLKAVILTHWHHDHIGGVADLRKEFGPNLEIYKFPLGFGGYESPSFEAERAQEAQSTLLAQGIRPLQNNQTFTVAGATLTVHHTPGHTADHVVLVWHEENAIFTGDNVLGHGTAVFEDLATYLSSLEIMKELYSDGERSGRAYPGHGPVVDDGMAKIEEYIRHRKMREEQVLQTLRSSPGGPDGSGAGSNNKDGQHQVQPPAWTVMELVRSIYRDVPESLHPAAAGGVVQILHKLRREGRVVVVSESGDGERWSLAARSAL